MSEADENPTINIQKNPNISTGMKMAKPKRRSLIERELETNLTDRVTSPIAIGDVSITSSRYGRTRKPKQEFELSLSEKYIKPSEAGKNSNENVPMDTIVIEDNVFKAQPASTSKCGNIVDQNLISFSDKKVTEHKIYVRKDLIQKPEASGSSASQTTTENSKKTRINSHLNNILERSSAKYDIETSNDHKPDKHDKIKKATPSVVKTLDFDSGKRKRDDNRKVLSKSELFELETKCEYQMGDLAWARVGAYPFWPCIVTKDPHNSLGSFVKTKLFGRVERNVIHVTFFGDNGRRGWIVDNMLRKYSGVKEFETARDNFTPQDKKRDPRLYAAFIISEKQTAKWNVSVAEAETLLREPKRLRIDALNDMLNKARDSNKGSLKSSEKVSRTDSDVSLSESLYDSLFSEDDSKDDDKTKIKTKKSLDVSEVVTACIDNMAAMSGLPKIHKQSHMDRWLLKAKSKTPEKPASKKSKVLKVKKKVTPLKESNSYVSRKNVVKSEKVNITSTAISDSDNNIDFTASSTDEELCKDGDKTSQLGFTSKMLYANDNKIDKLEMLDGKEDHSITSSDKFIDDVDAKKEDSNTNCVRNGLVATLETDSIDKSMSYENVVVNNDVNESLSIAPTTKQIEVKNSSSVDIGEGLETSKCIEIVSVNKPNIDDTAKSNAFDLQPIYESEPETKSRNSDKFLRSNKKMSLNRTRAKPFEYMNGNVLLDNQVRSGTNNFPEKMLTDFDETKLMETNLRRNVSKDRKIRIETSKKTMISNKEAEVSKAETANITYTEAEVNEESNKSSRTKSEQYFENNIQVNGYDNAFMTHKSNHPEYIKESVNEAPNGIDKYKKERDETVCDSVSKMSEIHEDSYLSLNQPDSTKIPEMSGINITSLPLNVSNTEYSQIDNHTSICLQNNKDNNRDNVTFDQSEGTNAHLDDKQENLEDAPKIVNNTHKLVSTSAKAVVLLDRDVINKFQIGTLENLKSECSEDSGSDDKPLSVMKIFVCEDKKDTDSETEINIEEKDKVKRKPNKATVTVDQCLGHPEFLKYVELRQDALLDENPHLSTDDVVLYLYKTWVYELGNKPSNQREIDQTSLVKGLDEPVAQLKKVGRKKKEKPDHEKDYVANEKPPKDDIIKEKPKRRVVKASYNEDDTDFEDELKFFEIFRKSNAQNSVIPNIHGVKNETDIDPASVDEATDDLQEYDETEGYFLEMVKPKPNVFKGLVREKVCEVCERAGDLIKCKGPCAGMFHVDCAAKKKEVEIVSPVTKVRKKKKPRGRKPKSLDDSESQSDEKLDEEENRVFNADEFENDISGKLQELLSKEIDLNDYHSSDEEIDWSSPPGECHIIDIKLRPKQTDNSQYANFKCSHCTEHDIPLCFVCKRIDSPKGKSDHRQRCQVAHCNKYYHLECTEMWPQTQYSGDAKELSNMTCPRHVCHTCVCDDPRGCKTRFTGDKLARCVRCPATYHSFTKCLPAGSTVLSASHIICPRHHDNKPGKVPCHVNTGWCFICALGGTLICCEYCPTSFHAECLHISPPEGSYMCEDCETGRLPLYGEMVWVKLGHYRWWPGLILHPCEVPDNIMAVKHSMGEFVVRFFGQYDHYWVNRGRVFPFQEGDSGKVSSQKSKIDEAFTTAMEHAQRACEVMKTAPPNSIEDGDIAQSLLPPRYVKLRANKPRPPLARRDPDDSSLSMCDCDPAAPAPCAPHTQCLNRMLLTECGPSCRAGERCQNRAFERRLYPALTAYRTPWRGWGLKTLDDIKQGAFVIEYVGELIDEAEFRRRMRRMHETRDENYYFLTLDKDRMIDAGPKGNLARFMNHSCEPNCETQKWTVLGDVRVGLFALRDIPANTEVTFNYNLECAGIEKKPCLCGARLCSGYIGAKPKQEEVVKKQRPLKARKRGRPTKDSTKLSPSTTATAAGAATAGPAKPRGRPRAPRVKPKELTEIEKDLLIIKSATNGISSDSESSVKSTLDDIKAMKRKRSSVSMDAPCDKRQKVEL